MEEKKRNDVNRADVLENEEPDFEAHRADVKRTDVKRTDVKRDDDEGLTEIR